MLLKAIVNASLETLEDFCISSLNLMSNGRIAYLDDKVFAVPLEGAAGKVGPVVSYYSVRDPKPANDRLDELDYLLFIDLYHWDCFSPLSEFVDADHRRRELSFKVVDYVYLKVSPMRGLRHF
jgi:hypothetical protein